MRQSSLIYSAAAALHAEPVSIFEPVSLFGKTLDGWDYDPAMWRVEDGVITGGSTTEKIKKNDFICTKKNYQNFELKLKIKVSGDPKTGMLNSGIQIRSLRVPGGSAMSGYQVDCGAGWFGKIYDEHRRNKVIWAPTPEQQAALDKAIDVFGWNEYRIRAEGPRIQTWINGVHCMDYTETDQEHRARRPHRPAGSQRRRLPRAGQGRDDRRIAAHARCADLGITRRCRCCSEEGFKFQVSSSRKRET
jgi:hypothetical protein